MTMTARFRSSSYSAYPKYPSFLHGRRYTLTGIVRGNRFLAQRISPFNVLRCQDEPWDIGQPHNDEPVFAVAFVQDDGDFRAGISDGLIHPPIGIASLHPLAFQMDVSVGRNDVWAVLPTGELLSPPCCSSHGLCPGGGAFTLLNYRRYGFSLRCLAE